MPDAMTSFAAADAAGAPAPRWRTFSSRTWAGVAVHAPARLFGEAMNAWAEIKAKDDRFSK